MADIVIVASSRAEPGELAAARLGIRFGRLDLCSRLAVVAVEKLGINFDTVQRDRMGICLAAKTGSLATDIEYWKGRGSAGGPSPTLFAYTLPSSAIGEIAIRHGITGPNLCFFGDDDQLTREATWLIESGEVDACICVACKVIDAEVAQIIKGSEAMEARATFLQRQGNSP